nr:hypothetical protein [Acidisoma sp. PAMC 29798]
MAAPGRRHAFRIKLCQFRESDDIELEHGAQTIRVMIDEIGAETEGGIVDEDIGRDTPLVEPMVEVCGAARDRKVYGFDDDLDAMGLPEVCGEGLHLRLPPRRENEVDILGRQGAREGDAETAGGTGDQSPSLRCGVHTGRSDGW